MSSPIRCRSDLAAEAWRRAERDATDAAALACAGQFGAAGDALGKWCKAVAVALAAESEGGP